MVGTFNEHVAQPQKNPYDPPDAAAISMGLETDPFRAELWVDMYGDAISRDLEPTVEDGGAMWSLFSSCMRVFKGGVKSCAGPPASKEACCAAAPEASWNNVWSLALGTVRNGSIDATDMLLTHLESEKDALVQSGAWTEVCAPFGGATAFCADASQRGVGLVTRRGPFLLYAGALAAKGASRAVYRCAVPPSVYFPSGDPACRGIGTRQATLGFAGAARSSETPRSLRLCQTFQAASRGGGGRRGVGDEPGWYHSLDAACAAGDQELEHLGFVH